MVSVVLLMAGRGTRMGYERNKILLPFGDKYLFEFPLNTFLSLGYEVICVISKEDSDIIIPRLPSKNVKYVYGGTTRQESVYLGLKKATGDYVLIHDAARMWVSEDLIHKIIEQGKEMTPVLTYTEVKDTIKVVENGKLKTLDRKSLIAAATPQAASLSLLKEVYEAAVKDNFTSTDDMSLIEKYHPEIEINLVKADEEIFKVTTPKDYEIAKEIWRKKL